MMAYFHTQNMQIQLKSHPILTILTKLTCKGFQTDLRKLTFQTAYFSKFCCLYSDADEAKQSKITVLNNFIIQPHSIEVYFSACSSIQLIQRE